MKKQILLSSLLTLSIHGKTEMITQALELAALLKPMSPEQKAAQAQDRANLNRQEETNRKQLEEKEQAEIITKLQKEQDRLAELRKEEQETQVEKARIADEKAKLLAQKEADRLTAEKEAELARITAEQDVNRKKHIAEQKAIRLAKEKADRLAAEEKARAAHLAELQKKEHDAAANKKAKVDASEKLRLKNEEITTKNSTEKWKSFAKNKNADRQAKEKEDAGHLAKDLEAANNPTIALETVKTILLFAIEKNNISEILPTINGVLFDITKQEDPDAEGMEQFYDLKFVFTIKKEFNTLDLRQRTALESIINLIACQTNLLGNKITTVYLPNNNEIKIESIKLAEFISKAKFADGTTISFGSFNSYKKAEKQIKAEIIKQLVTNIKA